MNWEYVCGFAVAMYAIVGPIAIYQDFKKTGQRRKKKLLFDAELRRRLERKGFSLCEDRCDEHKTGWCIRVCDRESSGLPDSPDDADSGGDYAAMQDVAKTIVGVWAGCADPISVELCRRVPEEGDALCHILLKSKRR